MHVYNKIETQHYCSARCLFINNNIYSLLVRVIYFTNHVNFSFYSVVHCEIRLLPILMTQEVIWIGLLETRR